VQVDRQRLLEEIEIMLELEKRECKNYRAFLKRAWDVIEPATPLVWNWHLDALADEFQLQAERIHNREPKQYDLVINVPPRTLKSTIGPKLLIPYVWSRFPEQKFLTSSHSMDLALEHAVNSRECIQSEWYQGHWGDMFTMMGDQNVKSFYKNDRSGYRITVSVGATAIGRGGDWIFVDDPISAEGAASEKKLATCTRWWRRTMNSRLNDKNIGIKVIIMQRLHEDDLTGEVLRNSAGSHYKHFCFPAIESDNIRPVEYQSKYVTGLLFPERLDELGLKLIRQDLGSYGFAGQYQQRPSPEEGGVFKRQHWGYWYYDGEPLPTVTSTIGESVYAHKMIALPREFDETVCSWDMAMVKKSDNDPVSGTVWSRKGPDLFLLDEEHGRKTINESTVAAKTMREKWFTASGVLIEQAAGGFAAIESLKKVLPGVQGVVPTGSKEVRAVTLSRLQEAGNVWLPHPKIKPDIDVFVEEFVNFPNGAHDDRVDSSSQAANYLVNNARVLSRYQGNTVQYKVALDKIAEGSVLYGAIVNDRSLRVGVVVALYKQKTKTLYPFVAFEVQEITGRVLEQQLRQWLFPGQASVGSAYKSVVSKTNWVCLPDLFGPSMIHVMSDLYTVGISPVEVGDYTLSAGASVLNALFYADETREAMVKINSRCVDLRDQLTEWKIDKATKPPRPAEGCLLGQGMCLLAQALGGQGYFSATTKSTLSAKVRSAQIKRLEAMTEKQRDQLIVSNTKRR